MAGKVGFLRRKRQGDPTSGAEQPGPNFERSTKLCPPSKTAENWFKADKILSRESNTFGGGRTLWTKALVLAGIDPKSMTAAV